MRLAAELAPPPLRMCLTLGHHACNGGARERTAIGKALGVQQHDSI